LLYFFIGWLLLSFLTFFGGFQQHLITKLLLTRYTPYFAFGGMLGYFYMHKSTLAQRAKWLLCGAMCLTAFLPYYISTVLNADTSPVTNAFGMFDTKSNILVLGFFIIVPLAVYLSEKITKKEWIQGAKILGGITYPLYILHDKLGSLIAGTSFGMVTWISTITAVGMIIASFYISRYEEIWRKHAYKKIMEWPFFKSTQNKNI
jgi:hypothetical protein